MHLEEEEKDHLIKNGTRGNRATGIMPFKGKQDEPTKDVKDMAQETFSESKFYFWCSVPLLFLGDCSIMSLQFSGWKVF